MNLILITILKVETSHMDNVYEYTYTQIERDLLVFLLEFKGLFTIFFFGLRFC